MSRKRAKELDESIFWKSELSISPRLPTESRKQTRWDNYSMTLDCSQTEDDFPKSDVGLLIHKLFRKQLYTDVVFHHQVGKESLSAHRAVLAAKCQFFAELLFGKKTKEAKDMKMTVEISNVPFNIFKKIIEYFYTDEIDLEDMPTMLDIFLGAKQFQVQSLVKKCETFIESLELTEDKVCSILQMCSDRDIKELRNRCIFYIQENTERVISSEAFQKCNCSAIYLVCSLPALSLNSEGQLIEAIARWAHAHPPHIKPQLVMPLLSSIRFLTLSAPELGSIIQKYPDIMTADDALKIMIFLNSSKETRSLHNLPAWCNRNTQRRCFKQEHIESAPKGTDPNNQRSGKILISLKPIAPPREIIKQSSLLRMECIKGSHQINAIKFSFRSLSLNGCVFLTVSVKVAQQKPFFDFRKHFVTRSKEKIFEFVEGIKVSEGQVINIDVTAKSETPFSLFQLDKNQGSLQSEHFHCKVASDPSDKEQFFVSEVQYGPQLGIKCKQDTAKKSRWTSI